MQQKQMMVKEFANKHVPQNKRSNFYRTMQEWDGRSDVDGAFYDMDVMFMLLGHVKEDS